MPCCCLHLTDSWFTSVEERKPRDTTSSSMNSQHSDSHCVFGSQTNTNRHPFQWRKGKDTKIKSCTINRKSCFVLHQPATLWPRLDHQLGKVGNHSRSLKTPGLLNVTVTVFCYFHWNLCDSIPLLNVVTTNLIMALRWTLILRSWKRVSVSKSSF